MRLCIIYKPFIAYFWKKEDLTSRKEFKKERKLLYFEKANEILLLAKIVIFNFVFSKKKRRVYFKRKYVLKGQTLLYLN